MCNIASHQGNASQNHNEISPHTCQNGYHQEEQTCWQGCREKGILVHCWWESALVQPLRKTVQKFLKKLNVELSYDPTLLLQGVYLKKTKNTYSKRYVHSMFLCTFLVKCVSSLLIIPFSNTFRVSLQADSGGAKMAFEFLMFKIKILSLPWLQRTRGNAQVTHSLQKLLKTQDQDWNCLLCCFLVLARLKMPTANICQPQILVSHGWPPNFV